MDNQDPVSRPDGNQTSASLNISMQNTGPSTGEKESQSNLPHHQQQQQQQHQNQQEQSSMSPRAQAPASHNYATPMQPNLNSPNSSQQQMTTPAQQNLRPMSQGPFEQPIQQHQPLSQQVQYQQPQMSQQHLPVKPLLSNDSNITIPPQADAMMNQVQNSKQESLLPQKAVITKVRLSDELNIFDWFRTKEIISQIAERAKSSVDSVITTLDPGMKEYLYSGGNVNIVVISDNECQVSPIRDAFQSVFGRATVAAARPSSDTATTYPIRTANGLQEAVVVAQARVKKLRQDTNSVPQNQVVIAIQPTLLSMNITDNEIGKGPDGIKNGDESTGSPTIKWFYAYCILIEDPVLNVTLNCYSQFIPIDTDIVDSAKAVQLPADFPDKHLGFAGTIDELVAYKLRLNPSDGFNDEYGCVWLREWAGIYETQIVHQLSLTLAQSYRRKWNDCATIS